MEEIINNYLFNPIIGKIVAIFIGIGIIWVIVKSINMIFIHIDRDERINKKPELPTAYLR